MADGRIKDLTGEVLTAQIQALLNTLYLAVDDTSFSDAKKILLKSILTTAAVTANTNNYQAMTPKAFYDSIMTNVIMGINRLATDGEVTTKTLTGVLKSTHQTLMQIQWIKDWFEANGVPAIYGANDFAIPRAMNFNINYRAEMIQDTPVAVGPTLLIGERFERLYINYAALHEAANGSGTKPVQYTGAIVTVSLVSSVLDLRLSADGREISIYPNAFGDVAVSITVNATLAL